MTLFDTLLTEFFGSSLLLGFSIIAVMLLLVFFIKSSKYVIEGLALIVVYTLLKQAYIQPWVFFIVLALIGLDLAKLILSAFTGR